MARARRDDPSSSHEAAERFKHIAHRVRDEVVLSLSRYRRATTPEISRDCTVDKWSISPRMVELEYDGLVKRSGRKACLNSSNNIR